MRALWIVAVAVIIGIAIYLGLRSKVRADEEEKIHDREEEYKQQGLGEDEAKGRAAYDAALEALRLAQEAERKAQTEEYARRVKEMEEVLAALQRQAILDPTDPSIPVQTDEAEKLAAQKRLDYIASMEKALHDQETQLEKAMVDVGQARVAWESAKGKVAYWEGKIVELQRQNEALRALRLTTPPEDITLEQARKWQVQTEALLNTMKIYQGNVTAAKVGVNATAITLGDTISAANDIVGVILGLTGRIRLAGIVMALADRMDKIAYATRVTLAALIARLEEARA